MAMDENGRMAEEVPYVQHDADDEDGSGGHQHEEVHLDLELDVEVADAQYAFEVDLADAGGGKGKRHAEHAGDLQPEGPVAQAAAGFGAVARHGGHGVGDDGQDDHDVGAIEGGMAVHG